MERRTGAKRDLLQFGAVGVVWAGLACAAIAQAPTPSARPPAAAPAAPAAAPAAPAAAPAAPATPAPPPPAPPVPQVKPPATPADLAAGNFTATKASGDRYELKVTGSQLTSRTDVEHYMLYRAAQFAMENKAIWFELVEQRAKTDKVPLLARDPDGPRFSYRLDNWRPVWRLKAAGDTKWQAWSPFSGEPFPGGEEKSGHDFEVVATVILHKGQTDGVNPLAFEAGAVSDFLVNQVAPTK